MKISKQARRDAKVLFRACCPGGNLDEAKVRALVSRMTTERPRGYAAILDHFQRLVRLELTRRTARIETMIALDDAQRAAMIANLERIYGQGLAYEFSVNPALLGGARIRVGSDVYDGSIETRLRVLQEAF